MRLWLLAAALVLAGCGRREPLPVLGAVPPFQLTDQNGLPFTRDALDGRVWVADFIYTTCLGPCPLMSNHMRRLQERSEAALVSFTVDPARDTPPVLAEYARRYQAKPGRWYFLTGAREALNDLGLNGFKVTSVDGSLDHSTRFILVDRRQRIRGYYLSSDEGFLSRLLDDIRRLEKEP